MDIKEKQMLEDLLNAVRTAEEVLLNAYDPEELTENNIEIAAKFDEVQMDLNDLFDAVLEKIS